MQASKHTFCRICESLCGLEVTLENGQVKEILPDKKHVATQGYGCVKGFKQHEMYGSPDRLKYPLKKVNDEFVRVSWAQALSEIGDKVKTIQSNYSKDSVGMYVGTAAGFSVLHPVFAQGFMTGIQSNSMFSSATQDCSNKFAVSRQVYGFPFTLTFPDLEHTECLIIVGANPVVSKWSFLQVVNPKKTLQALENRGGKIFTIDPRKTETAKAAGTHVFIRPNTDVFFYLSFLHELLNIGAVDHGKVQQHMTGYDEIVKLAKEWPAERTEPVTKIPAQQLKDIVSAYANSNGAALYCSTGVNMGSHGSLAFWLQEVINAISGNLDKKGGTLVGEGVIDFAKFGVKNNILMNDKRSRIGDYAMVNDTLPGGILADEILTPGKEQIRGMFITGGNPLLTMANSERLKTAFKSLDLLVCLDIFPGETCAVADYVLPCTDPMQRPDLPFVFPLMLGLQSKPYLQATKAITEIEGEQRDEASIYLDLAQACDTSIFGSKLAHQFFNFLKWSHSLRTGKKYKSLPQETLLSGLLRLTKQKSFKQLLKYPHGDQRKPHQAASFLGHRVVTEDGKIHLAPDVLLESASQLEAHFVKEQAASSGLRLITRRAITTHNSWTHNYERFVSDEKISNYIYMHPSDAEANHLSEGSLADVSTDIATIRLPVKHLPELMPGTVAVPHGWGHQHSNLEVASKTKGVNVNLLAADGPDSLERVSGMAHLTGIAVVVAPAAGDQQASWSGL